MHSLILFAAEYIEHGHVSDKLDMYAFAIVLLELMTSKPGMVVAGLHYDEPDLFTDMGRHVDAKAGDWPVATVEALAAVAEKCISIHARTRPHAREVVPRLEALL